jgi:hypothetical protein
VRAAQNLHERRLSRAIFAQENVDLSASYVEADIIERHDSRKFLPDSLHSENRRFRVAASIGDCHPKAAKIARETDAVKVTACSAETIFA